MNLHQILCYAWTLLWGNYAWTFLWGNSEGRSYGQLVIGSFITAMCLLMHHVSCRIFGETPNHSGDSAPLWPRLGTQRLLAFPKTKITFEREGISDYPWDSGKYNGAADGTWENCVSRFQGAFSEGDWGVIFLCTMFLVSCIFFNKCFYFSSYMAGYLLDRPRMYRITFYINYLDVIFWLLLNALGFHKKSFINIIVF